MVRIRLRRTGARNQPAYRIVAADKEKPRDGRFLEILGHYNPRTEPATIEVDEARLFHWLKNGAQPSESVRQIMQVSGAWDRWNRYRDGEELEALLEEAAAAMQEVDPRTRRDDLVSKKVSKKAKKKAVEEVAAEAKEEAEEEPQAALEEEAEQEEPDEQIEDEASAAPEAEAEESESEDAEEDAEAEGEQGAEQSEEAQEEEETEAEASDEEEEAEAEASDEEGKEA
jgi:small subunit ribosomal protein S16